jgi:hypothetical protein
MSDVDRISQVEMLDHSRSVGRIVVHIVASGHLCGTTVTAHVVGDDAIAIGKEEQHLRVPVVRRQRPAVVKHNGLGILRAPVFVENRCAILCGDRRHKIVSSCFIQR